MKETKADRKSRQAPAPEETLKCTCVQDPFLELPPELRPRPKNVMGSLRKVTCPGCGFVYWTNRETDLCLTCEKKGVRLPEESAPQGDDENEEGSPTGS